MKNILVVDDHPMVLWAIEKMLKKSIESCSVFLTSTLEEAQTILQSHEIHLIILDLSIPGGLGIDMLPRLRNFREAVRILIYSGRDEMSNAPIYLNSGANGYIHKSARPAEFESAVRTVLEGRKYIKREVQDRIIEGFVNNTPVLNNPLELLTAREKEILAQLVAGKWTKQIAHDMKLKISTVSTHKARILEKIQVKNVIELLKKIEPFQAEI